MEIITYLLFHYTKIHKITLKEEILEKKKKLEKKLEMKKYLLQEDGTI